MNNNTNEIKTNNTKLIGTAFWYGGRQTGTGKAIVNFVVSDSYVAGKNPDGSPKLAWKTKLDSSMILDQETETSLIWEEFKTAAGKKGVRARISVYGAINPDRRDPKPGERKEHIFWINPIVRDGKQMVFPLTRREAPVEKQPGDNTPPPAKVTAPKAAPAKAAAPKAGPDEKKEIEELRQSFRANDYEELKDYLNCDGRGWEGQGYFYEERFPDFHMQEFINEMKAEMNAVMKKAAPPKATAAQRTKAAANAASGKKQAKVADVDASLPY